MLRCQCHLSPTKYRRITFQNGRSIRSFSAQTKAQRSTDPKTTASTQSESDEFVESESQRVSSEQYEDSMITLTPKQKLREWTRMYHQIESAKWVKHHLGC